MKAIIILLFFIILNISCTPENNSVLITSLSVQKYTKEQKAIINETFNEIEINKFYLYTKDRQEALDKGLAKDSSISYLWQQKAMPLYKQGKYELALPFLDKAVKYNRATYLPYRAFMKCIFAKQYKSAIIDFETCIKEQGNLYEMDHTYKFYIALSYLQLNEFELAEDIFQKDIEDLQNKKTFAWIHHLDLFYYGISLYEQKKYNSAIKQFDLALTKYPEFSDALFYKAMCLEFIGNETSAKILLDLAKKNAKMGYTINEDNTIYERYPYQIRWTLY